MRRRQAAGFLALALALLGTSTEHQSLGNEEGSAWIRDYAAARALARETGRPMLVVFR